MKSYITIQKWITNYPNPIILKKNDIVEIIEKENTHPTWKNWLFCKKQNHLGWVPRQLIKRINNNKGLIKEFYSAKELNVNIGEKLFCIKELNGWVLLKKEINNEQGWLPLEILSNIDIAIDKQKILKNICYTELVYGRINKKLHLNLTKKQIEALIYKTIQHTNDKHFSKKGKNYYITNTDENVRITINSNTFRVITVDRV